MKPTTQVRAVSSGVSTSKVSMTRRKSMNSTMTTTRNVMITAGVLSRSISRNISAKMIWALEA